MPQLRRAAAQATDRTAFRRERRPEERVQVLGAAMDLVKPAEVLHLVERSVAANKRVLIANHNLHSLFLYRRSPGMAAFYERADLVEVDSLPLILWARLIGSPSRRFHRCTYLDWRQSFWSLAAQRNWRVFYLGGAPGVPEQAVKRLKVEWPDLNLGSRNGYFDATRDSAENAAVLREIQDYKPDILLVGMGMPRQEEWVAENLADLPPCAILTVGAAFDYEAGVQSAAPRWLGQVGLEWLYRLARDPGRLFGRYCVEPWFLIGPAAQDVLSMFGRRKRPDRAPDRDTDARVV